MKKRSKPIVSLLTLVVILSGCWWTSYRAYGQTQARQPAKTYTNKTFFHLPIQIDQQSRSAVREVILYVKNGAGPWTRQQVAGGAQTHFTYQVPGDGEYWFNVVTIDKLGRSNPPDINKEPPALVVHVDTTAPTVKMMPQTLGSGETALRCTIEDENPNYESLKLSYQGSNKVWQKLNPIPGTKGMFHLPNVPVLNGTVRYTAMDRAGNVRTQEVILREKQKPAASPVAAQPEIPEAPVLPPQDIIQTKANSTSNHQGNSSGVQPPSLPQVPAANPLASGNAAVGSVPNSATGKFKTTPGGPGRQLINTTLASVDYRIDKVGPSGVSKVDVWIKGETASAWQRAATDVDLKSPVQINLPHEGFFGVRLAVTNGNGFGGKAPRPSDEPSFWIEVDTTSPMLQIKEIGEVTNGDTIDIHWVASDKNLGATPVNLTYASSPEGPWLPIAQNLKNTGHHVWQFPRNIGSRIYLRIEVADDAGNTARVETTEPISLDLTEPQAQIVGVSGVSGTSASAGEK